MRLSLFSRSSLGALVVLMSGPAWAQTPAERMYQAYGMDGQSYEDPFYAAGRDDGGVRLVVNGRPIDLQDRSAGYSGWFGAGDGFSSRMMSGPTLRGPTLGATAVGNNISVSNVSNTTVIVNATNNGNQIAVAQGRRR
jgi:hypothetical protein